jgi:hypothetical protein
VDAVTVFFEDEEVARGSSDEVPRLILERFGDNHPQTRAFDDATGKPIDLDYRNVAPAAPAAPRGPGRPRLGVSAREVTLLPRHWEWLAAQPGGASAALRRLVEEARRKPEAGGRAAQDRVYHFMQSCCGDRPGYEEALRALYKGDSERFAALIADWPQGIRAHIARLLG